MAYKNKEDEKVAKKKWYLENQDKVKASRARYNEKRRQRFASEEDYRAKLAEDRQKLRKSMTPEQREEYYAKRREYQREWQKKNYARSYERHKLRMEADPEYAKHYREKCKERNARRSHRRGDETPEQREARLRRNREAAAKLRRDKPKPPPKPKIKLHKKKPQLSFEVKKPGRLLALAGWRGW